MEPIKIIDRGRGPELSHIRITVFDILPYLQKGWLTSSIAIVFGLTIMEVEALVEYIHEHEEEVMAVNQKIEERIARDNPPHIKAMLRESRKKLLALREELKKRSRAEDEHARDSSRH